VAIEHALRTHGLDLASARAVPAVASHASNAQGAPAIELEHVTFHYPLAARPAIDDVSLSVSAGEVLAIVGNNGSGKTTLGKLMLGLLAPRAGSVRILGQPIDRIRPELIGYIYQNPDAMLSQMSVTEEVSFTPKLLGRANWREQTQLMLDHFGLTALQARFPLALSKGQRQRLAYAAVAAASPPILIFDEPTTGIDLPGCDQIMEYMDTLRRQGKTIVFITHDMALATRWADRVLIMHAGRVSHAGSIQSLAELSSEQLAAFHLRLPPLLELAHRLGIEQRVATPDDLVGLLEPAACVV
jgi:energy-coupling factor transport system ATP-binding protein